MKGQDNLQNTTININCYRSRKIYLNSWTKFPLNNRQPSKLPPHKRPSSETSRETDARKLIGQAKREPSRYSTSLLQVLKRSHGIRQLVTWHLTMATILNYYWNEMQRLVIYWCRFMAPSLCYDIAWLFVKRERWRPCGNAEIASRHITGLTLSIMERPLLNI